MNPPETVTAAEMNRAEDLRRLRATECVWAHSFGHLKVTNNEVILPLNVVEALTWENVDLLRDRLSRYLNKKVSPVFDRTISAIRLTSAEHKMVPIDDEVRQDLNDLISMAVFHNGLKMPAVGAHVPRPPNSWILYRQHHHRAIKEKNPKATNCELSQIIAKMWHNESEAVRENFKTLAEEMKRRHAIDHPDYQYSPRRPGEKRPQTFRYPVDRLPFLRGPRANALLNNAPNGLVEINNELIDCLDEMGLIQGPGGLGPLATTVTPARFEELVNYQMEGQAIQTVDYSKNPAENFQPDVADFLML